MAYNFRTADQADRDAARIRAIGRSNRKDKEDRTMTKQDLIDLLCGYDDAPDSPRYCDALCVVADALGLEDDDLTSDDLRSRVDDLPEDWSETDILYLVGIGGSPRDQRERYDDLDEACEACVRMAREQAEYQGLDPDDIELYGAEQDLDPDGSGMGACPSNDDGAYWPEITIG
jgi:hypothetical protein